MLRLRTLLVLVSSFPVPTAVLAGCDEGGGGAPPDPAGPRAEVVAHLGAQVILPGYRTFAERAETLRTATAAYAADPASAPARTAARDAWIAAMEAWQRAEMFHVGPALPSTEPGGANLRLDVYPWPDLRTCAVDELTVSAAHDDAAALAAELPSRRGLGAIEYLLFAEGDGNACSPLSAINEGSPSPWGAMVAAGELAPRRARQATALAAIVEDAAAALVARWEPSGGAFLRELTEPRRAGAVYGSAQRALNAITDAVVGTMDLEVEDLKLGRPAGLNRCDFPVCPDAVESPWARRSKEHVAQNLLAFERVFFGGEPGGSEPGLDDVLVALGADAVVASMTTELAEARAAVDAIPGPISVVVAADPAPVVAAHDAVTDVRVLLETTVLSVLDLEPPQDVAADND